MQIRLKFWQNNEKYTEYILDKDKMMSILTTPKQHLKFNYVFVLRLLSFPYRGCRALNSSWFYRLDGLLSNLNKEISRNIKALSVNT